MRVNATIIISKNYCIKHRSVKEIVDTFRDIEDNPDGVINFIVIGDIPNEN